MGNSQMVSLPYPATKGFTGDCNGWDATLFQFHYGEPNPEEASSP